MERRVLGKTGIEVSRMCLGSLTMGPLQANIGVEAGARLLSAALDRGVSFIDTAELYRTYEQVGRALRGRRRESIVVSSRCYAYTYRDMRLSIERALLETGLDYIDLFGLHEQETRLTLKGHSEAIRGLVDAKREGLIRAVAVSTHAVEVVRAVVELPEIDVVHPIFNMRGIGIIDGTVGEMEAAILQASAAGVGVYSMKALGGGHLFREAQGAIRWVLGHDCIHSVAIGVKTEAELSADIAIMEGREVSPDVLRGLAGEKRLLIEEWCARCGACVAACGQGALHLGTSRAEVDPSKCVLCGYCVAHCPEFCIKVV
ncbi:MAG: aldo/keto reductase [Clostridia bacterium]|nr:aldo/keto reductase [Clostridia bacterium]